MNRSPFYLSLLLLLTCAKEDSQNPGTTPSNITPRYTLTASAGEGGSVSPTTGSFNAGTQVSLTATPNSGYTFSGWSNGSTVNPVTVTLNSNTSITANFALIPVYTITVTAEEGGSVSSEGGEYQQGTQVTLTATSDEGYEFSGWSDGNTEATRVITASEDLTLTASFSELIISYTLTVTSQEGGSVNSEGGEYNEGTEVTLTATASEGYRFTGWSDGSTEESITITLSENTTLEALFELIPVYTVTVTSEGGMVTGPGEYQEGTEVTLTATPDEGYRFTGWSDGSTEESITITLSEDTTLEALFELIPVYTVTVTGEGGVVTGAGEYQEGTEVTITATPDEGYRFTGWSDGSIEESITITLSEDINLEVLFERNSFVSKAERFSYINETTSYYQNQKGFVRYIEFFDNRENLNINYQNQDTSEYWIAFGNTAITNDFNNDGFIDAYSFLYHFPRDNQNNYGYEKGKHILISDYFGKKDIIKTIDSNISWASVDSHTGDFDNNGFDDILIFADNEKPSTLNITENYGGLQSLPIVRGELILNYGDLNFERKLIGSQINSHDGGSTGDVDNDGDIDIVITPIRNNDYPNPKLFRNNGSADFSSETLFDSSFDQYFTMRYYSLDLFDVNGDGYLDLIAGSNIGDWPEPTDSQKSCCYEYNYYDPVVFFGNGSGQYNVENKVVLDVDYEGIFGRSTALGFGFSDFDLDGDIDIFLTTTLDEIGGTFENGYYNSYTIFLFENINNQNFIDVTKSKIQGYFERDNSKFTNFYSFVSVDIDSDGDFDIAPFKMGTLNFGGNLNYKDKNLYWENVGGAFIRRSIDD